MSGQQLFLIVYCSKYAFIDSFVITAGSQICFQLFLHQPCAQPATVCLRQSCHVKHLTRFPNELGTPFELCQIQCSPKSVTLCTTLLLHLRIAPTKFLFFIKKIKLYLYSGVRLKTTFALSSSGPDIRRVSILLEFI